MHVVVKRLNPYFNHVLDFANVPGLINLASVINSKIDMLPFPQRVVFEVDKDLVAFIKHSSSQIVRLVFLKYGY